MSSQKLIFLCVAEKRGESEVFMPSTALPPSPAEWFIVAEFDSCNHLRWRAAAGGEEEEERRRTGAC